MVQQAAEIVAKRELALNTLKSFNFRGRMLSKYVRDCIMPFVQDPEPSMRQVVQAREKREMKESGLLSFGYLLLFSFLGLFCSFVCFFFFLFSIFFFCLCGWCP
jgi:hypothetical protein